MRIRTRLLLLVLAVLIPAFIAAAAGIAIAYNEAQKANRQALREATRALGLLLDNEIETREGILESLAYSSALDGDSLSTFKEQAGRTAARRRARILLTSVRGEPLLDTGASASITAFHHLGNLQELRNRQGPEGTVVSNLYFVPDTGTYHFTVQVPVKRNGSVRYYLSWSAQAGELELLLHKQQLPSSWVLVIADGNGHIAARSLDQQNFLGRPAREGLVRAIREHGEGFYPGVTPEGVETLAFYTRTPKAGWGLAVNVPRSELRQSAVRASVFMAVVALLLLACAVFAAYLMARATVAPIESLRRMAERLGRGEAVKPEHVGITEMETVSRALARASADIRGGRAELEQRVKEAVAQAERSHRALLQSQKLEALGRLSGGMAHDFNNILQTLTSALQLAQLTNQDKRVANLIETCENAVARAAGLTRKLLAFGRVQDAGVEMTEPASQIRETVPLLKQGGVARNVEFRLVVPETLWPVAIDKLQFEIALLNLTINASEAMPEGGVLQLEAHNERLTQPLAELPPGDYVRITVSDSGVGMAPEVLSRALEPFYTTKEVGKGSGIGLSQAYGFAKQAGGTLLIHSSPGKGTAVIIYLPRAEPEGPASEATGPAPQTSAAGVVLFVEDDPLVREAVKPALEAMGFQVHTAADGEEAFKALESGARIDYVFSDVVMPGRISGVDLAKLVTVRHPHIKIVLATGYSDQRISLPRVRVLAKPYDMAEVVDALTG